MYARRRNCEHGRIKRANRKAKTTEPLSYLFGASVKLFAIWISIMLLDFFAEFRFEFVYPCWLFVHTVVDSFRYQSLAFSIFFAFVAVVSDLFCYFLVPTTLIYVIGSSFVWIQLVWQTDRDPYGSSIILCFVFVYVEIAVRSRDSKTLPSGIDICRPFAAHSVGYPAVTLGFVLKSMLSHHLRLRQQRAVEAQNITFFSLLEEALPVELRRYWRPDDPSSTAKLCLCNQDVPCSPSSMTEFSPSNRTPLAVTRERENANTFPTNHRKRIPDCEKTESSQTFAMSRDSGSSVVRPTALPPEPSLLSEESRFPHPSSLHSFDEPQRNVFGADPEDNLSPSFPWLSEDTELSNLSACAEILPSGSDSKLDLSFPSIATAPSTSPILSSNYFSSTSSSPSLSSSSSAASCCGVSTRLISHITVSKGCDVKLSSSTLPIECLPAKGTISHSSNLSSSVLSKLSGGPKQMSAPSSNPKGVNKGEYTLKLETEIKQLKSELQSLRALEVELRAQVQQLTAAERTYRVASSQARQECETLQTKLSQLNSRLETERANLQATEKQLTEERRQRVALEHQFSARQQSRHSGRIRKELVSSSGTGSHSVASADKGTNARSVTYVSRGVSTTSLPSDTSEFMSTNKESLCASGDSCAARVKELEAEISLLSLNLSAKDLQLTALKDSRALHFVNGSDGADKSGCRDERTQCPVLNRLVANHAEKDELLSKLRCLQEENQRMTDTLKEEDKMKQELMTAYHSSLREITDLNASLTRKEFQIVELNMRLEGLTPHLCDYLNMLNGSFKYFPTQGQSSSDSYAMDQYQLLRTHQLSDSSSRHSGIDTKIVGRSVPNNHGLADGRSVRTPPNGLDRSSGVGCFSSKTGYMYPAHGSGFFDASNIPVSVRPPCIGDSYPPLLISTGCGVSPRTFEELPSSLSNVPDHRHTCTKANLSLPPFLSRPSAHVSDELNRFDPSNFDPLCPGSTCTSSTSSPFYQQSRLRSTATNLDCAYPEFLTRPLPIGNSTPCTSPHSPIVSSPVLFNPNISRALLTPPSLRCDLQSFSTGCTTTVSSESLATASGPITSALACPPNSNEFSASSPTTSSYPITRLMETMQVSRPCVRTVSIDVHQQPTHDVFCCTNADRVQPNTLIPSSDGINAFLPVTMFSECASPLHFLTSTDVELVQSSECHPMNENPLDSEPNLSSDSHNTPTLIPSSSNG